MANITLNCRFVPKGELDNLPRDREITIDSGKAVSELETAIQNNLGASFKLEIRQIHPSSAGERRMQSQALISEYFNGQPDTDHVHIKAYPAPPKEEK